jgi:hypothetical protein
MAIPKLPRRSMIQLVACLVVTLAAILLLVYPEYAALEENDLAAARLRLEIEAQQTLTPLFQEMLKKSRLKDTGALVLPERKPWPKERAADLMAWFQQTGRNHRLAVEVGLPDAAGLIKPGAHLHVDVIANGSFADFQPFLADLHQAPFLDHIERIQILAGDETQQLRMKLWIAQA